MAAWVAISTRAPIAAKTTIIIAERLRALLVNRNIFWIKDGRGIDFLLDIVLLITIMSNCTG